MTSVEMTSSRTTGAGSWLRWTVAGLFGLIYTAAVWLAVFHLIVAAGNGTGLSGAGWAVMLLPVIFPVLVYVAAFIFARRRRVWQLALVYVAGLALVAVFWLDIVMLQVSGLGASLVG